jgi:hypothetical protein
VWSLSKLSVSPNVDGAPSPLLTHDEGPDSARAIGDAVPGSTGADDADPDSRSR